ncbi:MAG: hypothetical protein JRI94_18060 [Deltaproteobacteria bacterium]|nr:hypothetical protein [Deltaproteobacteria bacterium]
MIRDDISNKLIHMTKGETKDAAAKSFLSILQEGRLRGGTSMIKGGHQCVCFTEAPVSKLATILSDPSILGVRYAPFGIMVDKAWLFRQGGRPVIYQSDEEYEVLPDPIRYRHVRYEPENGVDFTWEREWRINTAELILEPSETTVVVPTRNWEDYFMNKHIEKLQRDVRILGGVAVMHMVKCQWHFIVLEDLGINIQW